MRVIPMRTVLILEVGAAGDTRSASVHGDSVALAQAKEALALALPYTQSISVGHVARDNPTIKWVVVIFECWTYSRTRPLKVRPWQE